MFDRPVTRPNPNNTGGSVPAISATGHRRSAPVGAGLDGDHIPRAYMRSVVNCSCVTMPAQYRMAVSHHGGTKQPSRRGHRPFRWPASRRRRWSARRTRNPRRPAPSPSRSTPASLRISAPTVAAGAGRLGRVLTRAGPSAASGSCCAARALAIAASIFAPVAADDAGIGEQSGNVLLAEIRPPCATATHETPSGTPPACAGS